MSNIEHIGYLYILEVSDIDLPVCKIGQTSKSPYTRCAEINRSSTGDFLWQVAHEFPVNDCRRFERIVHKKLEPYRQKNREFFNVAADVALDAVKSILDAEPEIKLVDPLDIGEPPKTAPKAKKRKRSKPTKFQQRDTEYAEILLLFAEMLECKGRPFGQLNKPYFGLSDGNEGVQWNISIFPASGETRLGVNLEGMKYTNWPIADFILSELSNPKLFQIRMLLTDTGQIFVRLVRDAWQVTSRPFILEQFIGPELPSLKDIDADLWERMMAEALACLSEERAYRGRALQDVTLKKQPNRGDRKRKMEVSPHLTVWTPVSSSVDIRMQLEAGIKRLKPIYEWVSQTSHSG